MRGLFSLCLVALLLSAPAAAGDTPAGNVGGGVYLSSGALADGAAEARARAIMRDLRCMVCQSQSVADSDAPLAADMRHWVRARVAAGKTDAAIRQELASHYGEGVLMRPVFGGRTWLLWLAPVLMLMAGGGVLIVFFRRGGV